IFGFVLFAQGIFVAHRWQKSFFVNLPKKPDWHTDSPLFLPALVIGMLANRLIPELLTPWNVLGLTVAVIEQSSLKRIGLMTSIWLLLLIGVMTACSSTGPKTKNVNKKSNSY